MLGEKEAGGEVDELLDRGQIEDASQRLQKSELLSDHVYNEKRATAAWCFTLQGMLHERPS